MLSKYEMKNVQQLTCYGIKQIINDVYNIKINDLTESKMSEFDSILSYNGSITSQFRIGDDKQCKIEIYGKLLNNYLNIVDELKQSIRQRKYYRIDYVVNKSIDDIQQTSFELKNLSTNYLKEYNDYNTLQSIDKLRIKLFLKNLRDILSYNKDVNLNEQITDECDLKYYIRAIEKYNETKAEELTNVKRLIADFESSTGDKITGGSSQRKKSRSRSRSKGRSKNKGRNKSKLRKNFNRSKSKK